MDRFQQFIRWSIGIILVVSLVSAGILHRDRILFSFSPQASVDPQTTSEVFDPSEHYAYFNNEPVVIPSYIAELPSASAVLGESAGNKRIEIDLTNQRLYAFEGNRRVYDFLVSTGKWGRTPTGTFNVWTKLRATKMEGGSKALRTYYYLPNVPYTMYFYNASIPKTRGYGIHGTYWHNNFGHPMSHGCINMRTSEAKLIFEWSHVDIPIVIYGKTPAS